MAVTRKRCRCSGHRVTRKDQWVVTQRGFAIRDGEKVESDYCELKCRVCLAKWRTKAGYTRALPDWSERTYTRLTHRAILGLILAGRIRADFDKGEVWKERKTFGRWSGELIRLQSRSQRGRGTSGKIEPNHQYVVICDGGCRREISLARLVWMAYHKKVIPDDYDVDHIDNDPTNNAITNLAAIAASVNRGVNDFEHDWSEVLF